MPKIYLDTKDFKNLSDPSFERFNQRNVEFDLIPYGVRVRRLKTQKISLWPMDTLKYQTIIFSNTIKLNEEIKAELDYWSSAGTLKEFSEKYGINLLSMLRLHTKIFSSKDIWVQLENPTEENLKNFEKFRIRHKEKNSYKELPNVNEIKLLCECQALKIEFSKPEKFLVDDYIKIIFEGKKFFLKGSDILSSPSHGKCLYIPMLNTTDVKEGYL